MPTANLKDLWISVVGELLKAHERPKVFTWFKNTAALSLKEGVLTIGLPLPFFLTWHQSQFARPTLAAAQKIDPSLQSLEYLLDLSLNENDPRVIPWNKHFPESAPMRKLPGKAEVKLRGGLVSKMLNSRYTLENFIVAPENRLAHAACMNVARLPGQNYNPLIIYGGVGLGKTHLLQGVGNEMKRNNPEAVIVYSTTENFTNEVIQSIQERNMNHLRNKYRKVDAFIMDDVQFIANKDRTQEEFFHTFNALFDAGKQIVLSSDRPPHELKLMDERLVSRLESGMLVDVKMPDYESRLAILHSKCKEAQAMISPQVLEFLAFNVTNSVRSLEGVLKQLIAVYELEHTSPTVKLASEVLRHTQKEVKMIGFIENDARPHAAVTLDQLLEAVSGYYTVPKSDIVGESRTRECAVPRQVVMYLAKTKLKVSLVKIGESLGHRNHTTVMHSIGKIGEQIKNDRQLLRDVNAIAREVGLH